MGYDQIVSLIMKDICKSESVSPEELHQILVNLLKYVSFPSPEDFPIV